MGELAIVIGFPLVMWARDRGRRAVQSRRSVVGLAALLAADWKFKFDAVLPIMTPVLLIGGMTTGVFTPTEGAIAPASGRCSSGSSGTAR